MDNDTKKIAHVRSIDEFSIACNCLPYINEIQIDFPISSSPHENIRHIVINHDVIIRPSLEAMSTYRIFLSNVYIEISDDANVFFSNLHMSNFFMFITGHCQIEDCVITTTAPRIFAVITLKTYNSSLGLQNVIWEAPRCNYLISTSTHRDDDRHMTIICNNCKFIIEHGLIFIPELEDAQITGSISMNNTKISVPSDNVLLDHKNNHLVLLSPLIFESSFVDISIDIDHCIYAISHNTCDIQTVTYITNPITYQEDKENTTQLGFTYDVNSLKRILNPTGIRSVQIPSLKFDMWISDS